VSSAQLDLARTIHREREAEARVFAVSTTARLARRERRLQHHIDRVAARLAVRDYLG